MAEDNGLCTYEKHHKQKILLFLSSMRSYADSLKQNKFKLAYLKIEDKDFKDDYFIKLKKIISKNKITEIPSLFLSSNSGSAAHAKNAVTSLAI